MRAETGVIFWNQIKQCFVVIYILYLHRPNWSQTFLFLPFPEYIASLQVFYFTGVSPWQTRHDSLAFSPWHVKPCQNNSTLLPRPLLQNFGVLAFFFFQSITSHIWFPQNSPYLPNLSHLTHHEDHGWSLVWSTTSSRYLFNKWNKAMQWSEHGKRAKKKPLVITSYRAVASSPGPAMATA